MKILIALPENGGMEAATVLQNVLSEYQHTAVPCRGTMKYIAHMTDEYRKEGNPWDVLLLDAELICFGISIDGDAVRLLPVIQGAVRKVILFSEYGRSGIAKGLGLSYFQFPGNVLLLKKLVEAE